MGTLGAVIPERMAPLLDEVRPLAERFHAAGHRIYLVGGSVRDAILGRPLAEIDLDFTTDARPDAIQSVVSGWADAVWTQGK
ncbi:MAG: CCA tRNA nucleotidyltransferase, partial [Actinomycetota bacterium]|nr:CCA tRNA nucleotidyltransferase [Actinomycetota bacterium]